MGSVCEKCRLAELKGNTSMMQYITGRFKEGILIFRFDRRITFLTRYYSYEQRHVLVA